MKMPLNAHVSTDSSPCRPCRHFAFPDVANMQPRAAPRAPLGGGRGNAQACALL